MLFGKTKHRRGSFLLCVPLMFWMLKNLFDGVAFSAMKVVSLTEFEGDDAAVSGDLDVMLSVRGCINNLQAGHGTPIYVLVLPK